MSIALMRNRKDGKYKGMLDYKYHFLLLKVYNSVPSLRDDGVNLYVII